MSPPENEPVTANAISKQDYKVQMHSLRKELVCLQRDIIENEDKVLFNRSWYNRAGVEPVMGFCTEKEHTDFLRAVPMFEEMLVHWWVVDEYVQ